MMGEVVGMAVSLFKKNTPRLTAFTGTIWQN